MATKKIVYIDMDGVLADFAKAARALPDIKHPDLVPGIFRNLDLIDGAENAVKKLCKHYDCYVLTTASWNNPTAWADKLEWIKEHFGQEFNKKLIMSHHKDLLIGDYLIDDRTIRGAAEFKGKFIHFGSENFPDWKTILDFLLDEEA